MYRPVDPDPRTEGRHRLRTPPKIASALLRYFGGVDEGAVGDLLEEFQSGKSSAWYWRQGAGIVSAAVLREVRVHPTALALCLLLGWFCAWEVSTTVVRLTIDAVFRSYSRWYFANGGLPPLPLAPFVTWILNFAIRVSTNAFGGFVAVRCYRGHRPLMALMFAAVVACQQIALIVSFSIVLDATTMPASYVFQPLPPNVAMLVVPPVAALLGGMLGTRRQSTKAA